MTVDLDAIRSQLSAYGQEQLLAGYEDLEPGRRGRLLESLQRLPFDQLARLRDEVVLVDELPPPLHRVAPHRWSIPMRSSPLNFERVVRRLFVPGRSRRLPSREDRALD